MMRTHITPMELWLFCTKMFSASHLTPLETTGGINTQTFNLCFSAPTPNCFCTVTNDPGFTKKSQKVLSSWLVFPATFSLWTCQSKSYSLWCNSIWGLRSFQGSSSLPFALVKNTLEMAECNLQLGLERYAFLDASKK